MNNGGLVSASTLLSPLANNPNGTATGIPGNAQATGGGAAASSSSPPRGKSEAPVSFGLAPKIVVRCVGNEDQSVDVPEGLLRDDQIEKMRLLQEANDKLTADMEYVKVFIQEKVKHEQHKDDLIANLRQEVEQAKFLRDESVRIANELREEIKIYERHDYDRIRQSVHQMRQKKHPKGETNHHQDFVYFPDEDDLVDLAVSGLIQGRVLEEVMDYRTYCWAIAKTYCWAIAISR